MKTPARTRKRRRSVRLPLSLVLSRYLPTDLIPGGTPDGMTAAELWPLVWREIEREHVEFAPDYWRQFAQSVTVRQREPIRVRRVCGSVRVVNGHHRLWVLTRAGCGSVRVARC